MSQTTKWTKIDTTKPFELNAYLLGVTSGKYGWVAIFETESGHKFSLGNTTVLRAVLEVLKMPELREIKCIRMPIRIQYEGVRQGKRFKYHLFHIKER